MEGINKTAVEVPQDLIDHSKSRLLDTARFLRKVRAENRDEFRSVARKLKIGLRKAYHLAQIDEVLGDMDVSAERISASFGRFLADPDWKDEFVTLPAELSNEERVLLLMKRKIKSMGAATYLPDIPILKPRENRIKMRLILGTHSRKGVEVFRDVHGKVELSEIQTRSTISRSETGQLGLWSQAEESENQQRAVGVGSASQQTAARDLIWGVLANGAARFDDIAVIVMEQCAMRLTNTKDLLVAMRQEGKVAFDLPGRAKKPQPETVIRAMAAQLSIRAASAIGLSAT